MKWIIRDLALGKEKYLRWYGNDYRMMPTYDATKEEATRFDTPSDALNAIQLRTAQVGFEWARVNPKKSEVINVPRMSQKLSLEPLRDE